jgi:hypothetical protein
VEQKIKEGTNIDSKRDRNNKKLAPIDRIFEFSDANGKK